MPTSSPSMIVAMLAHELRNPLAPISTAAHILRRSGHGGAPVARASEIIERQVGHLTRLVDDPLDVSRVTRGLVELDRRPVDLRSVVSAATEQARPLIQSRGHQLETTVGAGPLMVEGDFHRLVQVESNLLHNAAKYAPQGGMIHVRLREDGKDVVLQVSDTGVGIPCWSRSPATGNPTTARWPWRRASTTTSSSPRTSTVSSRSSSVARRSHARHRPAIRVPALPSATAAASTCAR
ncbi:MAG: HAMP domain-containing histidine kinase [Myxococcota bacterium]|nr:HAMP domain-containing histidine kinase [Myxococcota bacterium]